MDEKKQKILLKVIFIFCVILLTGSVIWLASGVGKSSDQQNTDSQTPDVSESDSSASGSDSTVSAPTEAVKSQKSSLTASKPVISVKPMEQVDPDTIQIDENGDQTTMSKENMNLIGRFLHTEEDPEWYTTVWTGGTVEFSFKGSSAQCYLQGEDPEGTNKGVYVSVFVDGSEKPYKTIQVTNRGWYDIVGNLPFAEHTVKIYRLVEPMGGEFSISKIRITKPGILCKPPQQKKLKLEIIGDSITAGYGNMASQASEHFRLDQENGYLTYGAILGRKLDAQVHILGWSGIGILQNNDGSRTNTMPKLYTLIAPGVNRRVKWDFTIYTPDIILLNLGTNDMASQAPKDEFIAAYVAFLKQIRSVNPKAAIFCTMGVMGTRLVPAMEEAVLKIQKEGDKNVFCIPLEEQSAADGYGADGHPSLATHRKMADFFYQKISEYLKKQ